MVSLERCHQPWDVDDTFASAQVPEPLNSLRHQDDSQNDLTWEFLDLLILGP